MKRLVIALAFLILAAAHIAAQVPPKDKVFPELAKTPPMGWNSWNKFQCNVSEQLIKETADAIVVSGMKDAGYTYVNIDDCWQVSRDSLGFIQADPQRFPSGIKALADYIHSKGLKLGVYSDAGWTTCAGRPGTRGHEFQDAKSYAAWGVDYLKFDWCATDNLNAHGAYQTMAAALRQAGRPIVFSLCEWGSNKAWEWAKDIGHLWRTTGDIGAVFEGTVDHGTWKSLGVTAILDLQTALRQYAGPGHWNDPDMLEVGNGMTTNEDRAHFAMWSMLAAPLIAGNDIAHMSPETKAILTNKEVIAIDQDSLGVEALRYSAADSVETWFKPLANGDWAMAILNRHATPQKVSFDWKQHEVSDSVSGRSTAFASTTYALRDLWQHRDRGTTGRTLVAEVPAHDVLMLRLRKR